MLFTKTKIDGLLIINIESKADHRGSLDRFFCQHELAEHGIDFTLAQAYRSTSLLKNTLRGLHYQTSPKSEIKIIQCLRGAIFDLVIDLRPDSATYGQWQSVELTADNQALLLVPQHCAHGYMTLTDNCLVECLASEFYAPEYEAGVRWNDPAFQITWPNSNPIVSDKDQGWALR
jgi:dTDP-4-dehydrorhamnose 3,5-epimerase